MNEETLIEIFKKVGTVVGFRYVALRTFLYLDPLPRALDWFFFCIAKKIINTFRRLVFDRETGKPRGYGFCEFAGDFFFLFIHHSQSFSN